MSLLPIRCQIQDDMPMSLGKAIAAAIKPQTDRFASFYTNTSVVLPNGTSTFISEDDCKQIKGSAKTSAAAEKAVTPQPSPVAAPPNSKFKVGDRVRPIVGLRWVGTHAEAVVISADEEQVWAKFSLGDPSWLHPDNVELIPTPDAEGWVLVTMDAPDLKAHRYDWKYTNRNGSTEVAPAADVSAPLCDGNLKRFAQAGTYFYRVAP